MRPGSSVTEVDVTTATFAQSHHCLRSPEHSFALSGGIALRLWAGFPAGCRGAAALEVLGDTY